ncbi:Hypothetical Protein XCAW_03335 [Xanthomonas citri subsp. citri Aw12879]|nr:Hypothetical Protein XCAW_03335 [Xanthomonas citri subsp. citri Aw12879]
MATPEKSSLKFEKHTSIGSRSMQIILAEGKHFAIIGTFKKFAGNFSTYPRLPFAIQGTVRR